MKCVSSVNSTNTKIELNWQLNWIEEEESQNCQNCLDPDKTRTTGLTMRRRQQLTRQRWGLMTKWRQQRQRRQIRKCLCCSWSCRGVRQASDEQRHRNRKRKDAGALDLALGHIGVVKLAEYLWSRDTTTNKQTIDDEAIISAKEPDQDQLSSAHCSEPSPLFRVCDMRMW